MSFRRRQWHRIILSSGAEASLPLILKKIAPETIIYNDCYKAYERIDKNVYRYRTMDRSKNFADPDTGVRVCVTRDDIPTYLTIIGRIYIEKNIWSR